MNESQVFVRAAKVHVLWDVTWAPAALNPAISASACSTSAASSKPRLLLVRSINWSCDICGTFCRRLCAAVGPRGMSTSDILSNNNSISCSSSIGPSGQTSYMVHTHLTAPVGVRRVSFVGRLPGEAGITRNSAGTPATLPERPARHGDLTHYQTNDITLSGLNWNHSGKRRSTPSRWSSPGPLWQFRRAEPGRGQCRYCRGLDRLLQRKHAHEHVAQASLLPAVATMHAVPLAGHECLCQQPLLPALRLSFVP